ncbi:hypothetical protein [Nocardia niwae]|uniref:hypothetical protein n=1 Tax=Nocardia niwae TaxID=626084 RepID=UPI0007A5464E
MATVYEGQHRPTDPAEGTGIEMAAFAGRLVATLGTFFRLPEIEYGLGARQPVGPSASRAASGGGAWLG